MTKMFTRDYLMKELNLPWDALEDTITGQGRWSTYHNIIFQDKDGTYYSTEYSIGSTESQFEAPWEYEEAVECVEVEKRLVQVEQWVAVE